MTLNEVLKKFNRTAEEITDVYHGRDHACRCGCCGNYFKPGERGFTRAINRMNKDDFECFNLEAGTTYINIPYDWDNDKCYCVYFK